MSVHLIPSSEIGLHSIDPLCLCEPELVPEDKKGELDLMVGEMCYEHQPFNPSIVKDEKYEICNVAK